MLMPMLILARARALHIALRLHSTHDGPVLDPSRLESY